MWTAGKLKIKSIEEALAGAGIVVAIMAAAMTYYQLGFYTPSVIGRSQVTAVSKTPPARRVTAATRQIAVGRRTFWQVEISEGVWIDCGRDCAAMLRRSYFKE